jgi:selenocysteine lyase/cysteine desulfurase
MFPAIAVNERLEKTLIGKAEALDLLKRSLKTVRDCFTQAPELPAPAVPHARAHGPVDRLRPRERGGSTVDRGADAAAEADAAKEMNDQFSGFEGRAYLNCAYQGPFPRETSDAIREAIVLKEQPHRITEEIYFSLPNEVRAELGALIGASPNRLALTNGASNGIFAVASGLDWRAGDQVLLAEKDFPSNFYSWANLSRLGVETVVVPAGELLARLGPRTRVLCVSWITYNQGARLDLKALGDACRANGTLLVADLSQGAGALPIDLESLPVDVAVGCGYKWLLSPYGTGFTYFTPAALERVRVTDVYWESVEGAEDFNHLPREGWRMAGDARRFDSVETASFLNLYGMRASLRFLRRVGPATIERHVQGLFQHLLPRLPEGFRAADSQSTILAVEGRDPEATRQAFERARAAGVIVSMRQDRIRVSPHLYNSTADMDRLIGALHG